MNLIKNRGITLIEVVIIIFITGVISSIVLINLSRFHGDQAIKTTTENVVSLLNKARQNTLSSVNSTNYSVHFQADRAVLFSGSVYSSSDPTNEKVVFDSSVTIPSTGGINISGGGSDINFERLTGGVINGTISSSIVLQLVSDSTKQKTITINKTGIISSN